MNSRALGPFQVAVLLISASYGIGFLFGSGEMAVRHGMGGALYGIATAGGMCLLAIVARPLWTMGGSIWSILGRLYGAPVERGVAMLSLVWMAGVLAAQIHGGLAVAQQFGVTGSLSFVAVLALIFGASLIKLRVAATVFGVCLLVSAAVLLIALGSHGGLPIYLSALPRFMIDVGSFPPAELATVVVAVTLLVCTGADYQQFVTGARGPRAAVAGCLMAAAGLTAIAFLPPAVAMAFASESGVSPAEARQVIPMALGQTASGAGAAAGVLMLLALSLAALGSGAAILRAMADALQSGIGCRWRHSAPQAAALALLVGAALANRGQGIVQTMVSVNIVYLSSIGVVLAAVVLGRALPQRLACASMLAGFVTSSGLYLCHWAGGQTGASDLQTLLWGEVAAMGTVVVGWAWGMRPQVAIK